MSEAPLLNIADQQHYIGGRFIGSASGDTFDVINPAT